MVTSHQGTLTHRFHDSHHLVQLVNPTLSIGFTHKFHFGDLYIVAFEAQLTICFLNAIQIVQPCWMLHTKFIDKVFVAGGTMDKSFLGLPLG